MRVGGRQHVSDGSVSVSLSGGVCVYLTTWGQMGFFFITKRITYTFGDKATGYSSASRGHDARHTHGNGWVHPQGLLEASLEIRQLAQGVDVQTIFGETSDLGNDLFVRGGFLEQEVGQAAEKSSCSLSTGDHEEVRVLVHASPAQQLDVFGIAQYQVPDVGLVRVLGHAALHTFVDVSPVLPQRFAHRGGHGGSHEVPQPDPATRDAEDGRVPDCIKDPGHPWSVLAVVEHAKRLAKGQVGHDVESGAVEEQDQIERSVGVPGQVGVDASDELVDVLEQQGLLLAEGAVRKGVGEDLAHLSVRLRVDVADHGDAVGAKGLSSVVQPRVLEHLQLPGRAMADDVLPGRGRRVAQADRAGADDLAVLLMLPEDPALSVAGDVGNVVHEVGGCCVPWSWVF